MGWASDVTLVEEKGKLLVCERPDVAELHCAPTSAVGDATVEGERDSPGLDVLVVVADVDDSPCVHAQCRNDEKKRTRKEEKKSVRFRHVYVK